MYSFIQKQMKKMEHAILMSENLFRDVSMLLYTWCITYVKKTHLNHMLTGTYKKLC